MCKVYNPVGCLTAVKSHLQRYNITEFKSLNEVITFQREYERLRREIISKSEGDILKEKELLVSNIHEFGEALENNRGVIEKQLHEEIERLKAQFLSLAISNRNFWKKLKNYFSIRTLRRRIKYLENEFPFIVNQSVYELEEQQRKNEKRLDFINTRFDEAVTENCFFELNALQIKKKQVDEVNSMIYGALGEQKVVKELEKLPDDYVLINDFALTFQPPIYNRKENDYIKSIQIDHLLIAPSGLFLIETKNWSEKSMNNHNLRSPVEQLRRTNFALFSILNNSIVSLGLSQHHWGKKKVSLKSLLVFTNQKPSQEFQYVKVLTVNQLVSYIKYFPPIFTRSETENIAAALVRLSGAK